MTYDHFGGGQTYDHFDGASCANCESEPQTPGSLFCSQGCQDEYEGVGEYADVEQGYGEHDTIQELELQ